MLTGILAYNDFLLLDLFFQKIFEFAIISNYNIIK